MGSCFGSDSKKQKASFQKLQTPQNADNSLKFKIVILGDVAVGKTSILSVLKGFQIISLF